jgi:2-methylisocitrate lyase-like PEP mutase family enzyme
VKKARPNVFVNARTDIVLRNQTTNLTPDVLERGVAYAAAGADGFFVPRLTDPQAIEAVVNGCALPLNVLITPGLPPLPELRRLGVRRVSDFGSRDRALEARRLQRARKAAARFPRAAEAARRLKFPTSPMQPDVESEPARTMLPTGTWRSKARSRTSASPTSSS